jgi:transposase
VRQTKYDWLYVIGSVCPQTGQTVGLISPNINTNVINVFCEQFTKELCRDVHVVMLWDRAGFHTSKKLRIPENITVMPLPSYSPELNPVENLWHYFRSHFWANRSYSDYDDLRLAAVDGWRKAALDADVVKSVCRAKYTERRI